jgi:hypothetical protein
MGMILKWNDNKLKGSLIFKIIEGNDRLRFHTTEITNEKLFIRVGF